MTRPRLGRRSFHLDAEELYVLLNGPVPTPAFASSAALYRIWLTHADGSSPQDYGVSEAGLLAANSAASSGDIIKLPTGTYSGDVTITDGVKVVGESRYATILSGEITGGDDASIENLSVIRTANDGNTLKGVIMAVAGTFYLNGCDIEVTQSGGGDARALSSEANSSIIEAWNSYMNGDSSGGSGWGAWRDTGLATTVYIHAGRVTGSTNPSNE